MKEQIEEAAKAYATEEMHLTDKNEIQNCKMDFKAGANYTFEQTQPVIDELVKALEQASCALSEAQFHIENELVDATYVDIKRTLSKHKNK